MIRPRSYGMRDGRGQPSGSPNEAKCCTGNWRLLSKIAIFLDEPALDNGHSLRRHTYMRSRPVTPTKLSVTERLSRAKWHVYHQAVLIWVQLCGISSPPPSFSPPLGPPCRDPNARKLTWPVNYSIRAEGTFSRRPLAGHRT